MAVMVERKMKTAETFHKRNDRTGYKLDGSLIKDRCDLQFLARVVNDATS